MCTKIRLDKLLKEIGEEILKRRWKLTIIEFGAYDRPKLVLVQIGFNGPTYSTINSWSYDRYSLGEDNCVLWVPHSFYRRNDPM